MICLKKKFNICPIVNGIPFSYKLISYLPLTYSKAGNLKHLENCFDSNNFYQLKIDVEVTVFSKLSFVKKTIFQMN